MQGFCLLNLCVSLACWWGLCRTEHSSLPCCQNQFLLSWPGSGSLDKGTLSSLQWSIMQGTLKITRLHQTASPFPFPFYKQHTAQGGFSRTCLMMAVSTETWDVHSNLSYHFFLKKKREKESFGHNDKLSYTYFKTKFKQLHKQNAWSW